MVKSQNRVCPDCIKAMKIIERDGKWFWQKHLKGIKACPKSEREYK
jgi:hypothetical protein